MPSRVFPVPKFRSEPRRTVVKRPSLAVRIRTRWRRSRLDDELARGTVPAYSAELTLRAAQLRSPAERSRLANALVEALGAARGPNLGAFTKKARHAPGGGFRWTARLYRRWPLATGPGPGSCWATEMIGCQS